MGQAQDAQLVFVPKPFQEEFYDSTARFPGYIGPWGNGKTLCAIMKILALCNLYPGNEALITRRKFNALMKSTARDFTDWTGLKVSDSKQYVDVPGTGSRINFSHCDNLVELKQAMQGMNIGCAYIEQGDELDDGSIFDEIRGRCRRILTPNKDMQDQLIKLGVMSERVEDFRMLDSGKRDEIEEAITEKLNLPVRQIITIANANGHNWMYDRWHPKSKKKAQFGDGYHGVIGKPGENNEHIPKTTLEDWERLKLENPKKYARCVLNSFEDYEFEGSFYSALMSEALKEKRLELLDIYDRTVPVYTFWDLGVGNATAIWFVQFVGQSIRLIDYYQASGRGMADLSHTLDDKHYRYKEHWLPHDARQRIQGATVTTRLDVLQRLRGDNETVRVLVRHPIEDRIEAVRGILNLCRFSVKCEKGVECLNKYHREINRQKTSEEKTVYTDFPAKEYSDGADAFGYMAVAYRKVLSNRVTGHVLGYAGPIEETGAAPATKYDPLHHFTNKKRKRSTLTGARR